jgi:hypothetical protein
MACAQVGGGGEVGRSNRVAQPSKVAQHFAQALAGVAGDVLAEEKRGPALLQDTGDVWPEVPRVVASSTLAGAGEWLARVARSDEIHDSTPRATVEGSEIRPDRSRSHQFRFRFHARSQDRCRIGFPFHVANGTCATAGSEVDAEFESADSGAEG